MVNPSKEFPSALEEHRAAIEESKLDSVRIHARKDSGTRPWDSKFLGRPWMPKGSRWPLDPEGRPLSLLVQINFEDMPRLAGYPSRGLLQIFVSGEDSEEHVYGMRQYRDVPFDKQRWFDSLLDQCWFRVVYHPRVSKDADLLDESRPESPVGMLPIDEEAALTFSKASERVGVDDYRFAKHLGRPPSEFFAEFGHREDEVVSAYSRFASERSLAKIGGYGTFVQGDPRSILSEEDWVILLEIESSDSEDDVDVQWGDAGVANFLIRRADLERLDFSRVAYYWDCH